MERYDNLVLMGQDIAEYGGVFKITEGFVENLVKRECATLRFVNQRSSEPD
jgi:pyruvate/2-oxoglutarate/acetoin dehydrogenase E1 component